MSINRARSGSDLIEFTEEEIKLLMPDSPVIDADLLEVSLDDDLADEESVSDEASASDEDESLESFDNDLSGDVIKSYTGSYSTSFMRSHFMLEKSKALKSEHTQQIEDTRSKPEQIKKQPLPAEKLVSLSADESEGIFKHDEELKGIWPSKPKK